MSEALSAPKIAANFIMNDLLGLLKKKKIKLEECKLTPEHVGLAASLVVKGVIDKKQMKESLIALFNEKHKTNEEE